MANNLFLKLAELETAKNELTNKYTSLLNTVEQLTSDLRSLQESSRRREDAVDQETKALRSDVAQLNALLDQGVASLGDTSAPAPAPAPAAALAPAPVSDSDPKIFYEPDGNQTLTLVLAGEGVREFVESRDYDVIGNIQRGTQTFLKLRLGRKTSEYADPVHAKGKK